MYGKREPSSLKKQTIECYYDGGDLLDDEIELSFFGDFWLGITLSDDLSKFSMFIPFSYYDFRNKEIEEGDYDVEELENEKRTGLLEHLFYLWLRNNEHQYPISTWDDGAYMCPGYVARVGFYDIPFNEDAIVLFDKLVTAFYVQYDKLDNNELRKNIVALLCKKYDIYVEPKTNINLDGNTIMTFTKQRNLIEENVTNYYIGKEYAIFKTDKNKYVTSSSKVKLFYEIFDVCEMYDNVTIYCDDKNLIMCSEHLLLTISSIEDQGIYSKIEEMNLLNQLNSFSQVSSEEFKDVFYTNFSKLMNVDNQSKALIITEGITDYIHMTKYWEKIKYQFPDCTIAFWDFGLSEGSDNKHDMGGTVLLEMCKSFSRIGQSKPMIFIADCDDAKVNREISGINSHKYKNWGNNVYSFTLPIPKHRSNECGICIEHLFSNEEIKTLFLCKDGRQRRLYLGNEFDSYGRGIAEHLICTKRNICGKDSIKIIDGSSDSRVISYNSDDNTNYALSKIEFANKIEIKTDSAAFDSFKAVFDIVNNIINK